MPHKIKGKVLLANPFTTIPITKNANLRYDMLVEQVKRLVISIPSSAVTMTDGGANGSIGSLSLGTLHAKRLCILGCSVSLPCVAAANIGATATLKCSIGTSAEATDDTLDSVQANILPSTSVVLAASAGTLAGPALVAAAPLNIDATGGTQQLYLNFGVADAGSSGNSTVTITAGTVILEYVELN